LWIATTTAPPFTQFPLAETGDHSLAWLAATGNNLVNAMATFIVVPAVLGPASPSRALNGVHDALMRRCRKPDRRRSW
jgi:hypothetical protein